MCIRVAVGLLQFLFLLVPGIAIAADEDSGVWAILATGDYFDTGEANPRWRYAVDGQARYFSRNDGFAQYVLRPSIGYDLTDKVTGWLGYAVIHTDRDNARDLTEQLAWPARRWGPNRITMRARLIERWRNDGDDLAITLRLRAHYARRLENGFDLVAYAEPWYDFRDTDWGTEKRFSQMRLSAGVAFPARDWGRFEAGYLNQRNLSETGRDISNHLLYLSFNVKL